MNVLDPTTTSLITAVVVSVCCALFLVDTLTFAGNAAARLWAVAFSAGVLTAFAYMVWAFLPGAWMAVAVGNASFVASIGFIWLGCRRFNRPDLRWASWGLAGAIGATFVAAAIAGPDGGDWAGAGVMLAAMAALAGLACVETRRAALQRLRTAVSLTVVMAAVCAYYTARTVVFLLQGPDSPLFRDWFGTPSTSLVTIVLTIVAVTAMVVLRIQEQAASGARWSSTLTLSGDGFLDRGSFLSVLDSMLARRGEQSDPTTVVVLELEDVGRIGAAFGSREAARVVAELRRSILEHSPATSMLAWHDEARALLCFPGTSEQEAARLAKRIAQVTQDGLYALEAPVVPVLGIGLATTAVGNDLGAADLVSAAERAAERSALNADGSVVLAEPSAGGHAVAEPTDRLDPTR
jgi:GGDEF domain-containing protein